MGAFLAFVNICVAQVPNRHDKWQVDDNLQYQVEMQGGVASGKTPLWLNANKYGLSSVDEVNGYLRAGVERPLNTDSTRRWGLGGGVDLVVAAGHTSTFVVQQAYVEGRWLKGVLSVGSKEYPMVLKNNQLSSGAQTLGRNARPIPQVRLALPDYWVVPHTNEWLKMKGHIAYGVTTDDAWQKEVTGKQKSYAEGVLFHSKAGYLKVGKEECFYPVSMEVGLEMATLFGGKAHVVEPDGTVNTYHGEKGFVAFWHAMKPDGHDDGENVYQNAAGDILGSWVARVNYDADTWRLSWYFDKFFEDHSSMFQLDYDGYGEGEEWQESKRSRFLMYNFKDMMLGMELAFKYDRPVRHVVLEYLYTKYQSGPIYHDHTINIANHIGGDDNFYNHYLYRGWQHWGQVMGNPLYRSPIYNDEGEVEVKDSRFKACHIGVDGGWGGFDYRLLATLQEGVGTYQHPYHKAQHNFSFLAEASYQFERGALRGWSLKGGYGMDLGGILGNNYGVQFTISRKGLLKGL